jgi:hypothetical protein
MVERRGKRHKLIKLERKGDIIINTNEIQRIIEKVLKTSSKLENLEEMDKFIDGFDLPKLNQVEINSSVDL